MRRPTRLGITAVDRNDVMLPMVLFKGSVIEAIVTVTDVPEECFGPADDVWPHSHLHHVCVARPTATITLQGQRVFGK